MQVFDWRKVGERDLGFKILRAGCGRFLVGTCVSVPKHNPKARRRISGKKKIAKTAFVALGNIGAFCEIAAL